MALGMGNGLEILWSPVEEATGRTLHSQQNIKVSSGLSKFLSLMPLVEECLYLR
jgi:hypothetical protein